VLGVEVQDTDEIPDSCRCFGGTCWARSGVLTDVEWNCGPVVEINWADPRECGVSWQENSGQCVSEFLDDLLAYFAWIWDCG
jgi:hypothetical protein